MMTESNPNVHKQHLLAPIPTAVKPDTGAELPSSGGAMDPLTAAVDFAIKQRLLTGMSSCLAACTVSVCQVADVWHILCSLAIPLHTQEFRA